jgi:TRAP-type C4-dicarboxylate transport system permease small subunit
MLNAASDGLDRLCRWAALAAVLGMVAFIGVQVVARYLWSAPPGWTEEAARYAMVWAGLLGAAVAYKRAADPVMFAPKRLATGVGRAIGLALKAAATLLFLGPIWFYCLFGPNFDVTRGYIARSALRSAETIGVPLIWFTAALPFAITVIFVHLAAEIARGGRRAPEPA